MEPFLEKDKNMENSIFYFPIKFNFSDDEQELGFTQPYFEIINNNNIECGLSTKVTANEKENNKNKDEMNQFMIDETYFKNQIKKIKMKRRKNAFLEGKEKVIQGEAYIVNILMII